MTEPFTYLIGWKRLNTFYYGVRYCPSAAPSTLWTTYFTSSKRVKEFRKQHGEPDVVQVRRTFKTPTQARKWELTVIRRLKMVLRQDFLNQTDRPAPSFKGRKHTQSAKSKVSALHSGRKLSEEHKRKISQSHTGKCLSDEHKEKLREAGKNQRQSLETREKRKASLKGKKKSPEHVRAVVEAKKRRAAERALLSQ